MATRKHTRRRGVGHPKFQRLENYLLSRFCLTSIEAGDILTHVAYFEDRLSGARREPARTGKLITFDFEAARFERECDARQRAIDYAMGFTPVKPPEGA